MLKDELRIFFLAIQLRDKSENHIIVMKRHNSIVIYAYIYLGVIGTEQKQVDIYLASRDSCITSSVLFSIFVISVIG